MKIRTCDVPDQDGNFSCPFGEDNGSGFFCYHNCGVGADEPEIPQDEDEITAEDLREYQGRCR